MNIPFLCQNTAAIYKGNACLGAAYQMHGQDRGLEKRRRVHNVCWISTPCFLNPLLGSFLSARQTDSPQGH